MGKIIYKFYERADRYDIDQLTILNYREPILNEECSVPIEIANISETGIMFYCRKELPFFGMYKVKIHLWSGIDYTVGLKITRVRRERSEGGNTVPFIGYVEYGAEFIENVGNPDEMDMLKKLRQELKEYGEGE